MGPVRVSSMYFDTHTHARAHTHKYDRELALPQSLRRVRAATTKAVVRDRPQVVHRHRGAKLDLRLVNAAAAATAMYAEWLRKVSPALFDFTAASKGDRRPYELIFEIKEK